MELDAKNADKPREVALAEREEAVKSELKNYFKPEFINRLDDIVISMP